MRSQIARTLQVDELDPIVCLAPSGTDAEMIVTYMALMNHNDYDSEKSDGPYVTTLIAANGEVGSGTSLASALRHFDTCAPHETAVEKGSCLSGFEEMVEVRFAEKWISHNRRAHTQTHALILFNS